MTLNNYWKFDGWSVVTAGATGLRLTITPPESGTMKFVMLSVAPYTNWGAARTTNIVATAVGGTFHLAQDTSLTNMVDKIILPVEDSLYVFNAVPLDKVVLGYNDTINVNVTTTTVDEGVRVRCTALISTYAKPTITGLAKNTITTNLSNLTGVIE